MPHIRRHAYSLADKLLSELTQYALAAHYTACNGGLIRQLLMHLSTLDRPDAQTICAHLSLHVSCGLLCLGLRLRLGCPAPIVVSIPGKHRVKT